MLLSVLPFFRERAAAKGKAYSWALDSFEGFIRSLETPDSLSDAALATRWIIAMGAGGTSVRTAALYLSVLSGLYTSAVKEGLAAPSPLFKQLKQSLKDVGESVWQGALTSAQLDRFISMVTAAASRRGASPAEVRTFELLREGRFVNEKIAGSLHRRLLLARLPWYGDAATTLRSYWCAAALRQGADPEAILAAAGEVPAALPYLALVKNAEMDDDTEKANDTELPDDPEKANADSAPATSALTARVAQAFTLPGKRWYVMRLRPRVSFDELTRRLGLLNAPLARPHIFYPHEEIVRRIGRRRVADSRPLLPDIVFFRSLPADVTPLFRQIGDIAWCYRNGSDAGATYAAIPDAEFEQFQLTIGHFTPDYRVEPLGTIPLQPADRVVIVGGLFRGLSATVAAVQPGAPASENAASESVPTHKGTTIYRLEILGAAGIEWSVDLDARLLRPETTSLHALP